METKEEELEYRRGKKESGEAEAALINRLAESEHP